MTDKNISARVLRALGDLRDDNPDYDKHCATHHAGHAVIGQAVGVPYSCIRLSLPSDPHRDPEINNRKIIEAVRNGTDAWPHARAAAITALAGPVAESVLRPREASKATRDSIDAFATIEVFASDFDTSALEVIAITEILVRANWQAISRVAEVLLERDRLTAEEVADIISDIALVRDGAGLEER